MVVVVDADELGEAWKGMNVGEEVGEAESTAMATLASAVTMMLWVVMAYDGEEKEGQGESDSDAVEETDAMSAAAWEEQAGEGAIGIVGWGSVVVVEDDEGRVMAMVGVLDLSGSGHESAETAAAVVEAMVVDDCGTEEEVPMPSEVPS